MQAVGGELSQTSLLGCGPVMLKHQNAWQNVLACVIVAWLSWVRTAAFILDLKPAPQVGVQAWYCKPERKPVPGES